MSEMTPETLREVPLRAASCEGMIVITAAQRDSFASVWEADRARIEELERAMKGCPVPDENGDMDIGAMRSFCEAIATLAAEEKKP